MLESMRVDWPKRNDGAITRPSSWTRMYQRLVLFQQEHGHYNVPTNSSNPFANWVEHQHQSYAQPCLMRQRKEKLDALDLEWKFERPIDIKWIAMFNQPVECKQALVGPNGTITDLYHAVGGRKTWGFSWTLVLTSDRPGSNATIKAWDHL